MCYVLFLALQAATQARCWKRKACIGSWARNPSSSWKSCTCLGQSISSVFCMHHSQGWRNIHPNRSAPRRKESRHPVKVFFKKDFKKNAFNSVQLCRYNGRLFLSWLQDVDDKWEKIKEQMVLRHHNEAESLNAVQKMDWEWKVNEITGGTSGAGENSVPLMDDLHIPMVHVSDDFDMSIS